MASCRVLLQVGLPFLYQSHEPAVLHQLCDGSTPCSNTPSCLFGPSLLQCRYFAVVNQQLELLPLMFGASNDGRCTQSAAVRISKTGSHILDSPLLLPTQGQQFFLHCLFCSQFCSFSLLLALTTSSVSP